MFDEIDAEAPADDYTLAALLTLSDVSLFTVSSAFGWLGKTFFPSEACCDALPNHCSPSLLPGISSQ